MLKELKRLDLKSIKDEDDIYYSKMVQSEDGAWVRFSDCEKAVKDLTLAMSNIKIHFEHLCSEEMRVHGYVSHEHSIDFQVFRVLCGYREVLDELSTLKEAVKLERKEHHDYIQCDRNDGDKYKAARDAVDKLLEEQ